MKFKKGDKVKCVYGEGEIIYLGDDISKIHTVKMTKNNGIGYPATNLGIHESGLTLLEEPINIGSVVLFKYERPIGIGTGKYIQIGTGVVYEIVNNVYGIDVYQEFQVTTTRPTYKARKKEYMIPCMYPAIRVFLTKEHLTRIS